MKVLLAIAFVAATFVGLSATDVRADVVTTRCTHCVGNASTGGGHCEDNDGAWGPYSCSVSTSSGLGYPVCWDNDGKCCKFQSTESLRSTGGAGTALAEDGCASEEVMFASAAAEEVPAPSVDCQGRIVARRYSAEADDAIVQQTTTLTL